MHTSRPYPRAIRDRIGQSAGGAFRVGWLASLVVLWGASASLADEVFPHSGALAEARIVFISPVDGELVKSPVTVQFALTGMDPASPDGGREENVLLYLIVDAPLPDAALPILNNEQQHHFGAEQTEMTLDLKPGLHTLQLIAGDANHVPHEPPVTSARISISVSNLEVEQIGPEEANRYRRSVELELRVPIEAELPEEDFEGRRARREAKVRTLELLVDEIRRAKRDRAAEQQRDLTLEVEEKTGDKSREISTPDHPE